MLSIITASITFERVPHVIVVFSYWFSFVLSSVSSSLLSPSLCCLFLSPVALEGGLATFYSKNIRKRLVEVVCDFAATARYQAFRRDAARLDNPLCGSIQPDSLVWDIGRCHLRPPRTYYLGTGALKRP